MKLGADSNLLARFAVLGWLPLMVISQAANSANRPPVISGTPVLQAIVGSAYMFSPTAKDPNKDKLKFSAKDKPVWASFDFNTGVLSGIPTAGHLGTTKKATIISVRDGKGGKAKLKPFNISVVNGVGGQQPSGVAYTAVVSNTMTSNVSNPTAKPVVEPTPNPKDTTIQPPCTVSAVSGEPFSCQIKQPAETPVEFSLSGQPMGMVVQKKSGIIHWTPTNDQAGDYSITLMVTTTSGVTEETISLHVVAGGLDLPGIYIAPNGNDLNSSNVAEPILTLKRAYKLAKPGDFIYLRGGEYFNEGYGSPFETRTSGNLVRINVSGTENAWITIRPHGNEYVKLKSDVDGIQFAAANFWVVDGLELEGTAQSLKLETSMRHWWDESTIEITGRGISNNGAQHIIIRNCVIHDFAGAGVGSNGADFITVENNIIYNNGWWTTAGTHGFSNSYLTTTDMSSVDQEKLIMRATSYLLINRW